MDQEPNYIQLMDRSIGRLFRDAFNLSRRDPKLALFLLQTIFWQQRAVLARRKWSKQGIHVPPLLIFSVTHQCNLRCKGCYAQAQQRLAGRELDSVRLRELIGEAEKLGIGLVLLAGGEPLTRPEVLEIASGFPKLIFPVFTNGLLLDEACVGRFKAGKNLVPVISIEGDAATTDDRRGAGVYRQLRRSLEILQANRIFYGVSMTVTRTNCTEITGEAFVRDLLRLGCRLFFYVEYVPVKENTTDWTLTDQQRQELLRATGRMRSRFPALFIAFPGDEAQFGGCLAAGRGFIHISPDGNLEPCPFSPFSDTDLQAISLRDALQSQLLATIRANHERLQESAGGCTLWENRDWVESLSRQTGKEQ
jgi:MoaA/NifB/PqqE/SkfB family radical SAM enzyme